MSSELSVVARDLSKSYSTYLSPSHRLYEMLLSGIAGSSSSRFAHWARTKAASLRNASPVLKGVSFELQRGQSLGVLGRNGAGKSTLLQVIYGTLTPTKGAVDIVGRVSPLLELGSGFNPDFTGRENALLSAQLLGISQADAKRRLAQVESFAELGDYFDRPVRTYSSGMYVRLAFSVVVATDPEILIVDEALAVGDALFTQKCMRFMRAFKQRGILIFVSHDMGSVLSLCDKALWLDSGAVRAFGDAKTVSESYLQSLIVQGFSAIAENEAESVTTSGDANLAVTVQSTNRPRLSLPNREGAFGAGGAELVGIELLDSEHKRTRIVRTRFEASISVLIRAKDHLHSPIVGFFVKDALGQRLFGQNSLSLESNLPPVTPEHEILVTFQFQMPLLPEGAYSICVAVADGTQLTHVQHDWLHDALVFESIAKQREVTGMVGIPISVHVESIVNL